MLYKHPDLLPRLDKRLNEEDFVTPFNRPLYGFMIQRLRQNSSLDPTAFSAAFSVDEMGQIAALFQPDNGIEGSMEDIDRYIETLRQAKGAKTDSELVAMDPRDIQEYITRKAPPQQST